MKKLGYIFALVTLLSAFSFSGQAQQTRKPPLIQKDGQGGTKRPPLVNKEGQGVRRPPEKQGQGVVRPPVVGVKWSNSF